jgi:hypothetical protein
MRPLLSLINQNHPEDCYGWPEIHVLAWNYDQRGAALCAVRSDVIDGYPKYILQSFFGKDLSYILHGMDDGQLLYLPIDPMDLPFHDHSPLPGKWVNVPEPYNARALVCDGHVLALCLFAVDADEGPEVIEEAERFFECKIEDASGEGWVRRPCDGPLVWYFSAKLPPEPRRGAPEH